MTALLAIAVILMAFFMPCMALFCYRRGLQDGLKINGVKAEIEPVKPMEAVKQTLDAAKTKTEIDKAQAELEKLFNEGFANLQNYTGEPQRKPE